MVATGAGAGAVVTGAGGGGGTDVVGAGGVGELPTGTVPASAVPPKSTVQ